MPEQQTAKKPKALPTVPGALIVAGAARIVMGPFFSGPAIETRCYRVQLPKSCEDDHAVIGSENRLGKGCTEAGCITLATRISTDERFVAGIFPDNRTMDKWNGRHTQVRLRELGAHPLG